MKFNVSPITRLIARYGTEINIINNPGPDPRAPWQPADQIVTLIRTKGLIQEMKPVSDPDLPAGSIRAVAIIELLKNYRQPRPGDRLSALDRHWRIETILPVVSHRGVKLVEVVITSAGSSR